MSLELKLVISREILALGYHFSLVLTFSSPSPSPHPRLLPSSLNLRVVPLLFSLVFICISCGVVFSSHWFSFASLL